jgi:hypothetical protein
MRAGEDRDPAGKPNVISEFDGRRRSPFALFVGAVTVSYDAIRAEAHVVSKANETPGRDRGPVVDRHSVTEFEDATGMRHELDGTEPGIENHICSQLHTPLVDDPRHTDGPTSRPDGVAGAKQQLRRDPGGDKSNALSETDCRGQVAISV